MGPRRAGGGGAHPPRLGVRACGLVFGMGDVLRTPLMFRMFRMRTMRMPIEGSVGCSGCVLLPGDLGRSLSWPIGPRSVGRQRRAGRSPGRPVAGRRWAGSVGRRTLSRRSVAQDPQPGQRLPSLSPCRSVGPGWPRLGRSPDRRLRRPVSLRPSVARSGGCSTAPIASASPFPPEGFVSLRGHQLIDYLLGAAGAFSDEVHCPLRHDEERCC